VRRAVLLASLAACSPFGAATHSSPPEGDETAAGPPVGPIDSPLPLEAGADAAPHQADDCPVVGALFCETFTTRTDLAALDIQTSGGAEAELVGTLGTPDRAIRFTGDVGGGERRRAYFAALLGPAQDRPFRVSFQLTLATATYSNLVFLGFFAPDGAWNTTYYVYTWTEEGRLGLGQYMETGNVLTYRRGPTVMSLDVPHQVIFTVDLAQKTLSATLDGAPEVSLALTPPGDRVSMWILAGVDSAASWTAPPADIVYDDMVVEALAVTP
jgi:hypothetical protein